MINSNEKIDLLEIIKQSPHIVLVGAGASIACIPNGDKNGKKIPAMEGIRECIDLNGWYKGNKTNLEEIYQEIEDEQLKTAFENQLFDFYGDFLIPDNPTVYDHLIISMTKKDLIASFNWDPLLIQAYQRCLEITEDLPYIVFLHGNTWEWHGTNNNNMHFEVWQSEPYRRGYILTASDGTKCQKSKLLYPIKDKNYSSNIFIKNSWSIFKTALKKCFLFTIFGFSAPKSDILALDIIKEAFLFIDYKKNSIRDLSNFKQITFINPDKNIVKNFSGIISKSGTPFTETMADYIQRISSFYEQSETFLDTWPRLSTLAYSNIEYKAKFAFQYPNRISENTNWDKLKDIVEYNMLDKKWFSD